MLIGGLKMLNENEKIVSWDVVVKTTDGRELSCCSNLNVTLPDTACEQIDEILLELYPCVWAEDKCESCKKLGETTCGNDMQCRCFEPIV